MRMGGCPASWASVSIGNRAKAPLVCARTRTHARMHARTHARTHTCIQRQREPRSVLSAHHQPMVAGLCWRSSRPGMHRSSEQKSHTQQAVTRGRRTRACAVYRRARKREHKLRTSALSSPPPSHNAKCRGASPPRPDGRIAGDWHGRTSGTTRQWSSTCSTICAARIE